MRSEGQAEHPRRLAAAIFDVDGVLVASPHERAWQEAFAELMEGEWREITPSTSYAPGRFDSALYQTHVSGKPRMSGARAVLDFFGVPDSAMRAVEYAERKQRRIRELIAAGEFVAFVDALRFLVALRGRNVRTAAASSSKNANDFMRQIDVAEFLTDANARAMPQPSGETLLDMFDANVCGHDVKQGKPHPDIFLLAAQELRAPPAQCVVIEDAPAGVEAAKAGGMMAIGVARFEDGDLLEAAGADLVVTALDQVEVGALLAGQLQRTR
jgi:beta-phosphoglucomutase-like phosphatase (HAD superfamily)